MNTVFVVQSAQGHYFSKHSEWLSGKDAGQIYTGKYKDDALNRLIEITIKDVTVRAKVVEVELNARKLPVLEIILENDLIDPDELVAQEDALNETLEQPQTKTANA
jgi:hypothetical protein